MTLSALCSRVSKKAHTTPKYLLYRDLLRGICYEHAAHLWTEGGSTDCTQEAKREDLGLTSEKPLLLVANKELRTTSDTQKPVHFENCKRLTNNK